MRTFKGLVFAVALAALPVASAVAAEGQPGNTFSPLGVWQTEYPSTSVIQTACTECEEEAAAKTCGQAAETCGEVDQACDYCGGWGDCCGTCRKSSLEFGGWISAGVYANAHGATLNGPLGFVDLGDGFNLHQAWLYAEKAVNTGGCGFDWGYRADVVFGVDGPDTQAFGGLGWDTEWDASSRYGTAIPQFYGEVGYNNLSVKVGHFFTTIGYEVVPAPDNFFFSHSYTMYYAEPFTHTGFLAKYDWSDNVAIYGGWTQGWDTGFDNTPDASTFLGGVTMDLTDNLNFAWMCSAGTFGPATANKAALGFADGDIYMNSFVLQWAINCRWSYVLQHDLGINTPDAGQRAEWYGLNQYLQYKINECWSAGMRFEIFRDDDAARVNFNGPAAGNYREVTFGMNWTPRERLIIRPEVRYDWFAGTVAPGSEPFGNGDSNHQLSGGFDVIWTF